MGTEPRLPDPSTLTLSHNKMKKFSLVLCLLVLAVVTVTGRKGGKGKGRGKWICADGCKPTCSDGAAPACADGSTPERKKCDDGSKPSCPDGGKPDTCADGSTPSSPRNHARVVGLSAPMDPSLAVLMDPGEGREDAMTEVLLSALMDPICSARMDPNQSFLQSVLLNLSSLPSILSIKFAIGTNNKSKSIFDKTIITILGYLMIYLIGFRQEKLHRLSETYY